MRILYARNLYRPVDFGGNRYPLEVTTRLAERGHEIVVLTGRMAGTPPSIKGVEFEQYFQTSRSPLLTFGTHAAFGGRAARNREARQRPDVTVLSSYDLAYGYTRLNSRRVTPTVFIYHSAFHSESVMRAAAALHLKAAAHGLLRHVEETVLGSVDRIIAVSPFSERQISARLGTSSAGKIDLIPTGVDTALFSPGDRDAARLRLHLPLDRLVLITVGRLTPVKRYDRAIRATADVFRSGRDVSLLIVGDGPERLGLEDLARKLGISQVVRFEGFRDGAELVERLRAADLQLCTSEYENWSLALLEGLACAIPVLGIPRGGIPDLLRPVDPSLITPTDSQEDLVAAIQALDNDDSRRNRLSQRARAYAEGFGWDSVVARLEAVFERLIDRRTP